MFLTRPVQTMQSASELIPIPQVMSITTTAFNFNLEDAIWSQREKTYLLTCASNEDSDQGAEMRASPHSDQSLRRPKEGTLHPWLPKMVHVKILIRLREYAG